MVEFLKEEITKIINKKDDEVVLMQIYHFLIDYDVILSGEKGKMFEIEKYHKINDFKFFNLLKENVNIGCKTAILPYSKKYIRSLGYMVDDDLIEFNGGVTSTKIVDEYTIKENKIIVKLANYKFWNYIFK